jgi:alkylation response protein AidB-like acyl-CoA dehydrogenase
MTTTSPADAEALVSSRLDELFDGFDPATTSPTEFLGRQFDLGLAWVWFPEGRGGLGLSPKAQEQIEARLTAAGAPRMGARNPIAGMAAPTLLSHGSPDQLDRYLRPMFTCEHIWCQMFSEPGAGSDVAALATRAVRDGDEWIVNGPKVWTTMAHLARYGLLVARTDPEQPKHKGMSYFVLDMHAPGVEVRPLRQMTGEAEFNEVYFTDARIPDAERLGEEGEGWRVAMTTLMNERVSIGGGVAPRGSGPIAEVVRLWKERGDASDGAMRDRVLQAWVQAEVSRLTNLRAQQARQVGTPGPEGSIAKLAFAELNKKIYNLALDLLGPEGMLYRSYEMIRPDQAGFGGEGDTWKAFLRVRANSIEGGTSEIMRNILGERVLGLPREPATDRDMPFRDVPRS